MLEVLDIGKRTALFDDVLFLHRGREPEGTDPSAYIETEISGLLGPEESLDNVLYRFRETTDGYLIAVARRHAIQDGKTDPLLSYRIPLVVALWQRFQQLKSEAAPLALLYVRDFDHHYILAGDSKGLCRVTKLKPTHRLGYDVYSAVERAYQLRPDLRESKRLYCAGEIPDFTRDALAGRQVEIIPVSLPKRPKFDDALVNEWDFRLPKEIETQVRVREIVRVVRIAAFSVGAIAMLILGLLAAEQFFLWQGEKARTTWRGLAGSLREMNFLRTQNMNLMSELQLGARLTGIRTNQAAILQTLASSRPGEVKLDRLTFSLHRQTARPGSSASASAYRLVLHGSSKTATPISEWMAALSASPQFSGVKLVSVERRGDLHEFQMECDLRRKPSLAAGGR